MLRAAPLLALAVIALSAPASARDGGLRGAQSADGPQATSQAAQPVAPASTPGLPASVLDDPTSRYATDPAPRFSSATAPRVSGYAPSSGGACRLSCANDNYLCRADRDISDCDRAWAQCVIACQAG